MLERVQLIFKRESFLQEGASGPVEAQQVHGPPSGLRNPTFALLFKSDAYPLDPQVLTVRMARLQRVVVDLEVDAPLRDAIDSCEVPSLIVEHVVVDDGGRGRSG